MAGEILIVTTTSPIQAFRQPGWLVPMAINRVLPTREGTVLVSQDQGRSWTEWRSYVDRGERSWATRIQSRVLVKRKPRRRDRRST